MAARGARNLALVGRGAPSGEVQEALDQLKRLGVRTMVYQGDVSLENDVRKLLDALASAMPPLRGIVHAAGVIDDGILIRQNWERFSRVMAPKLKGAWYLHRLTRELSLDFLVLFSSAVSVLGSAAQGNYAAANAFLDGLAHQRRAEGLPAMSINWGMWAGDGIEGFADRRATARYVAQGFQPIAPDQGLKILEQILGQQTAQTAVFSVDWSLFARQFPAARRRPLLSRLMAGPAEGEVPEPDGGAKPPAFTKWGGISDGDALRQLETHTQSMVAEVLGLRPPQVPDRQQGFFDMGMDSLMAIELKNRLESALGMPLPSTLAFEYPTVHDLSAFLIREIRGAAAWEKRSGADGGGKKEGAEAVTEIEALSEEEALESVEKEVRELENLLREGEAG
jgi:myxalamid-type polyketide synthase MxaB